ncbi:MAG TPA: TonB-dependent receptor plug domain-containing protein, partial [Puia sp.]
EISYVGYKSQLKEIDASGDQTLSFQLEHNESQEQISQTTVLNDKRQDNVRKNQTALIDLSSDMIAAAPSVNGSGDVISSVEMLPGVQAGIDGAPGYFVRGGNAGQNLILLDEATLYNPSHIFGLVGIFNPPAIKYASLMKGGFPAVYGDHISSVLDVTMKDGSNQQSGGNVQMGSVSAGATLYGPLETGRSSYLISARRSTTDFLLRPLFHNNYFSHYYFYDVNAKLNFQLSPKDRLLVSFYSGRDNNNYSSDTANISGIDYSMNFGNTAFTLRWNHQFSGKLFSHSTLEYNNYHQFLSAQQEGYFAQLYSGIRDIHAKTEFNWYLSPDHKISAGTDYLHQVLFPATLSGKIPPPGSTITIVPSGIPPKTADRIAFYASDDIRLGERWQVYAGIRAPLYIKKDARYFSIEPRVSLLYMIDPTTSIKVSFASIHQYIHLVQSYNATFPAEIWIGSSNVVRPQISQEISAGLFRNFSENVFQTSLEFYYKRMGNQLLFGGKDSLVIDNTIEQQLIYGKGWSYGAEFFVRKNRGKWTGWLAYTLAWANQQFDSLNESRSFPFAYDRRHMLDISTAYAINSHWKVSANFLITSGRAFSLSPDSSYILNPGPGRSPIFDNPGRGRGQGRGLNRGGGSWDVVANNYRLSPYNRLDLNVHYTKSRTVGQRTLVTEWIISLYNVYARSNNAFVYRTLDPSTRKVIAKELPFIPVIPSITYSLKF